MTVTRRIILCTIMLVLTGGLVASAPPPPTAGDAAPSFDLVDLEGRRHTLAAYRGRTVILEWLNPDCPYVQRQYESRAMTAAVARVKAIDPNAVWLAVDSTQTSTATSILAWARRQGLKHPVLVDTDGVVGRRYDARRTPEMVVIDAEGRLRYRGAVDDNRLGRTPQDRVTNYVVQAVSQLVKGEPVRPEYVKPYGCKIKYRR